MKFKINLIDIGRGKETQEYEQEAKDLDEIANLVYVKVRRFLISSYVTMEPDDSDEELWNVCAGFHNVGKVRIREVKE